MATFTDKENFANIIPSKRLPVVKQPLTPQTKKRSDNQSRQASNAPKPVEASESEIKLRCELQQATETIENLSLTITDLKSEKEVLLSQRNELTTEKGELVAENNSLVEERDGLTDELAMLLAEKEAQMRNTLRREPKRVRLIQELKNERDYYKHKYEEMVALNERLISGINQQQLVEQNYSLSSAF